MSASASFIPAAGRFVPVRAYDAIVALSMREQRWRPVTWSGGRAEAVPVPDASQDAVVMALVLHHLAPNEKTAALREVRRILKPGGAFYLADFARPQDPLMSVAFSIVQLADRRTSTHQHRTGAVPGLLADAGFGEPARLLRLRTPGGTFEILRASAD
ncbi:MAG: methyltransferase domain-containing protein [Solirubrobacteraceae bacterium]|nr:methyltransferase domain-containing protein [Solirubrobacteraceae bacterium]